MEERGDGELKLAGVRAGGGGVLEVRGGALARERGDWDAGVPLVLKCTRGREPGFFTEFTTAAAMWRPRRQSGQRGEGRRAPGRVEVGPGGCGCRVWRRGSRRWPPGLPERQRRRSAPAAEEAVRERERKRRKTTGWTCLQIQKSLRVLL